MKRKILFFLYPYMLYMSRDETQDLVSFYTRMCYIGVEMKRKILFFLYPYMLYRGRDETQDLVFSIPVYVI